MSVRYAVIKNGVIDREYTEPNALDPSTIRIVNGEPMTRPIVNETVDNSTPGNTDTKSSRADTIEPTQVRRITTIIDKTAGEVDAERDNVVDFVDTPTRDQVYALALTLRKTMSTLYVLAEQANPGLTKAQFAAQLETNKSEYPAATFKADLKSELP